MKENKSTKTPGASNQLQPLNNQLQRNPKNPKGIKLRTKE